MTNQSYVQIERGVCVVCGRAFEAGSLMLAQHSSTEACVVGWTLCHADAQMHRLGFVALVECELDVAMGKSGSTIAPEDVHRTGGLMHITRETFVAIFQTETKPGLPCAYVPQGTLRKLEAYLQRALH